VFLAWKNVAATSMVTDEGLAFLNAHLINLSPAVLRQLKRDISVEKKRREVAEAAKTIGPGEGRQSDLAKEESAPPQKAGGKRKAKELDSSRSGGSVEPAARRLAPGPLSEAREKEG